MFQQRFCMLFVLETGSAVLKLFQKTSELVITVCVCERGYRIMYRSWERAWRCACCMCVLVATTKNQNVDVSAWTSWVFMCYFRLHYRILEGTWNYEIFSILLTLLFILKKYINWTDFFRHLRAPDYFQGHFTYRSNRLRSILFASMYCLFSF